MKALKDAGGRTIRVCPGLSGAKFAIRRGQSLYVSPAMMKLLEDCDTKDDLFGLLAQIPYRVQSVSRPLPNFDG